MNATTCLESPPHYGRASVVSGETDTTIDFGRFRVLLRQRRLLADGVLVELGARAFDLLLVLLEADGSLVTKEQLMSQVWPKVVVSDGNLKVQVSALRKALGADRDFIRTECGRGYRFIGVSRFQAAADHDSRRSPSHRALHFCRGGASAPQPIRWVPTGPMGCLSLRRQQHPT